MFCEVQELISRSSRLLDNGDPRIKNYFLMESPLPVIGIIIVYMSFVLKLGPNFMKKRAPFKIDGFIMLYNVLQIVLNTAILLPGLKIWNQMSLSCSPIDKSNSDQAIQLMNLQYAYTMLKILDLLDTIFFVLRKKNNQVTFLHVYHHIMMVSFSWISSKYFIGGQVYFLGIANLFVHVVMYFYYFLTSWDAAYKQSIWWKKHLTQLQIVQHCFVFIAFALPLFDANCDYPKYLLVLYLTQAITMIYLFTNFYIKTYLKKIK